MHRLNWKFCSRGARVRDNTHLRVPVHPPLQVCNIGAPEEIRTPDPQIRSLVLYPAELRALFVEAGPAGAVAADGE